MADIEFERRRRRVAQQLGELTVLTPAWRRFLSVPLMRNGWHVLVERENSRSDRFDAYAVGPGGVFALVLTEVVPSAAELRRIRWRAEETFANLTAGRTRYVPHMIEVLLLMDEAADTPVEARYIAVDPTTIAARLFSEASLSSRSARQIAMTVAERNTWFALLSADSSAVPETLPAEGLFETTTLRADERARALKRPFSEWMTFLDPAQLDLVYRNYNGPARFSGPAGTGKTVVALHRMARLSKEGAGPQLFTSFVRTLPTYHESGFRRLAPHAGERVEFAGLHSWTTQFLRSRDIGCRLGSGDNAFYHAWRNARRHLEPLEPNPSYWKDELHRVIKGQGIDRDLYLKIDRVGRNRLRLDKTHRELVWDHLYLPYQAALQDLATVDFNDVIDLAIDELRAAPLDAPYDLVVVDEVQDFTLMELKLVHQIAGGTSTSPLLLVGDGQQQVYPGGWRLSDAGIPIVGRGAVLRTNYRNRAAVHDYAKRVDATNTVDDLDGAPGFVLRDSEVVLPGGTARSETFSRSRAEEKVIAALIDSGYPHSDVAVITDTNRQAERIRAALRRKRIPAVSLEHYDGTQHDAVKVGTVHRAKGMDFAAVFHLTDAPIAPVDRSRGSERDRAELAARQTMVALTRARDHIWIGLMRD
ncbi:DEAD/DEAH box helicase [Nocardia sp. BSTN01]|uniref:UvrD-helicase domain-containing protein n=1 Tax=Nocardia sp. BSTN01 TaxID=2783665 RepID=UPI0018903B55|nr:UvrD-helicase domain-containing protein [Nocardia sp. BSTN01]MBF4998456.1 DEAD/DEAH box helicase [Nocardia sp. BSTN01]